MSRLNDLTGQKFGKLTVISRCESKTSCGQKKTIWLCQCECGKRTTVWACSLVRGVALSCGCARRLDLSGKRFGKLEVIEFYGIKKGASMWLCKCDCGNTVVKKGSALKKGVGCDCGCWALKKISERNTIHGFSGTRMYRIWVGMKNRCHEENLREYKYYGGRGIKVCDEWDHDFMQFREWAIKSGYRDDLTIDRIDVDGDYEPTNCRWVTMYEQQLNKRNSVYLTHNGVTKTLTEWSKERNMRPQTLRGRLYKLKWPVDKAIETPVDKKFGCRKGEK